jgi:glycosyltransferase involved in cell wall biosynthesis
VGQAARSQVAIVIVTRNRCDSLLTTLDHLSSLNEGHRIVVVDNGSTDGTQQAVQRRHPETTFIPITRNLGSAARTVGLLEIDEPYVAFCDDDSWWALGSLQVAARLLDAHLDLSLVAGRVLVGPGQREDPTCRLMSESPLPRARGQPGPAVLGFLACAAVVRRSAYLQVGGFHPSFGVGGEEELLALDLAAAGWELAYVAQVVAHHYPPSRPDSARRRRRQARNSLWCAWLRRPLAGALGHTTRMARLALSDGAVAAGIADAAAGLRWVLRERQPVGWELERRLRLLGHSV